MASATPSHSYDLRIMLLGKNGAEISAIGNMILGRKAFEEKRRVSEVQRGRIEDRNISVIDTPGFFNTELTDEDLQNEMMKSLSLSFPGPHVFLLTVNLDTFTEDDVRKIVKKIGKNFGAHVLKFTLVLFIREHMSNREWMVFKSSKTYQDLISHFRGKYHVIVNSDSDRTERTTLVEKLDSVVRQNDDQHYSNENYAIFPTIGNRDQREKVLVAKTNIRSGAVGKNATSNTILGNNLFKEEIPSIFNDHSEEHHTYEMCQELLRKYVAEQEKERDELRRTEEQRSVETLRIRAEELRTREDEQRKKAERELKNREEELRTRGEEQRKKEERLLMKREEELRTREEQRKKAERELKNREEELRTRGEEQRKKEERLLMKREEELRTREEQRKKEERELKKREKELRTREDEQRWKEERELKKREGELRNREEEQRKKEEREQKKREEELRTREDEQRWKVERELNKREEELRTREEQRKKEEREQKDRVDARKKEERDNLKTIFAEIRMTELDREMHMKRTADVLKSFIAASAAVKETKTRTTNQDKKGKKRHELLKEFL